MDITILKSKVYNLFTDSTNKDDLILEVFQHQYSNNSLFYEFVKTSRGNLSPKSIDELTFLPIEFFKSHQITSSKGKVENVFKSSGTTGNNASAHHIYDLNWYQKVARRIFEKEYGIIEDFEILGLLPSYLEKGDSSLVYMVQHFTEISNTQNPFYLHNHDEFYDRLKVLAAKELPIIVFGVSYALLDFAEKYCSLYNQLIFIETGGMKGRRKEMIKEELHTRIQRSFPNSSIQSEYGMTELLSQCYAKDGIFFNPSDTIQIELTEVNDPRTKVKPGRTGRINIIDLANIESCSFIATNDLGKMNNEGQFQIMGRVDNARLRGCNLLYFD